MAMRIKKLKQKIEIKFEQYECDKCNRKFYINTEDKVEYKLPCPFCQGETKNTRIFDIEINGIGVY